MPDLAQSTFILPQDATLTIAQAALKQKFIILSWLITKLTKRIYSSFQAMLVQEKRGVGRGLCATATSRACRSRTAGRH